MDGEIRALTTLLGNPEVRNLTGSINVQQDIVSFQVSMENPLSVQILQSTQGLPCQAPHNWFIESPMLP